MAYDRFKLFWGALDIVHSDESPYTPQQTFPGGETALPPGIGVRRLQFVFHRRNMVPAQDAITTHLDLLNLTNGQPDDTWIDADFSGVETFADTLFGQLQSFIHVSTVLDQYRWYRVGKGILPPNPAVRVTERETAGTGGNSLPPQVAASITLRTVPRRQWGRMYWPLGAITALTGDGRFTATRTQAAADSFNTFFQNLSSLDMHPVITSLVRGKAYAVESIQVDDVPDVIRSRRFNEPLVRARHPVP